MQVKIVIITLILHRAKLYVMCISSPWYLTIVPNMKKAHPAIMEKCVRMDKWIDRQTGPVPIFPDSTTTEHGTITLLASAKYFVLSIPVIYTVHPLILVILSCSDFHKCTPNCQINSLLIFIWVHCTLILKEWGFRYNIIGKG